MSQTVIGNTTYHDLNVNTLKQTASYGKPDSVGDIAKSLEDAYQKSTASTAKRVVLGILTFGIYAIAHAVKDSCHANTLKKLSRGTEALYSTLHDAMADANFESKKFSMIGEDVTLNRIRGEYSLEFKDGHTETIKDAKELLHKLELDVMKHSELFEKSFVTETILGKYEARIDAGVVDTGADMLNDLNELGKQASKTFNSTPSNIDGSDALDLGKKAREIKPELVAAKARYDELLATMFEARLDMGKAEVQYIERGVGRQLAAGIMDGSLSKAADARAFINRNSTDKHFTSIEATQILGQFEEAKQAESSRRGREAAGPKTTDIRFKDGYYQPKHNPVLPAEGTQKQVHEFVANIISDSNVREHDKDVVQGGYRDGDRMRQLFSKNKELVAQLMANRAETIADPSKPSLLATIEPEIRTALEEQLDKLNANYAKRLASASQDPRANIERLSDPQNGRINFLRDIITEQSGAEGKQRAAFGTADLGDVSNHELNQIGESEPFNKFMGGEAKKAEFMGEDVFLEEKRDDLTLGLNFFGEIEKKLDDSFKQAAVKLQAQVSQMIDSVFPDAPAPGHMSAEQIRNASLGDIIGNAAQDSQLQLIKAALQRYFREMPVMDQRSMMAAGTRFCVHGEEVSQGAKLGAILKGAGPVMQKMLQGLDPSMFAGSRDFQLALGDMKDKLAPISQDVIHAYLYDVVKNSNGQIKGIVVDKALGAASVAQALKCTISYADGRTEDAVVKILRPDAAMRAQREKEVFMAAAREVGNGMELTFQGQFAGIMEELDLRKEAENVKIGNRVYHHENRSDYSEAKVAESYGSFSNVHSMQLVEGIEPSINVMVLKQVQGNTLENYLKEVGQLSRETVDMDTLDKLYDDVKGKYEALVNLAYMWTNEGLFAEGFYHGDIHKGNIMTSYSWDMTEEAKAQDPGKGITLIDFGNASKLNKEERARVIRVVAGTAAKDAQLFTAGFRDLLSADSRAKFDAAGRDLQDQLAAIFEKGTLQDTAARMSAALKLMQREYQIEVPGPIHNFLESQRRLQVAMDETLSTLNAIEKKRRDNGAEPHDYKPGSMMKCITDVVKQHLYAAMTSIGAGNAKQCYNAIKGELNAPAADQQDIAQAGDDLPPHAIRV